MDFMEMIRRNMMGNQSSSGEESNVSSIFDIIFPSGAKRPGFLGIDDTQGLLPSGQEIPGAFLNFWQTRKAKFQALLAKMFDDIKEKANQQWQELSQKNAAPPQSYSPPVTDRSSMSPIGWQDPVSGLAPKDHGQGGGMSLG